jgi:hypothetical protein
MFGVTFISPSLPTPSAFAGGGVTAVWRQTAQPSRIRLSLAHDTADCLQGQQCMFGTC